jgi:hypothetical protein
MSMARTSANYIGPFSTNSLISMPASHKIKKNKIINWESTGKKNPPHEAHSLYSHVFAFF